MREGRTGQLLQMRGVNLEIALFIAQITGAVIVTDVSAMWRQLHAHTRAVESGGDSSTNFEPLRFTAPLHTAMTAEADEFAEAEAVQSAVHNLKATIDRRSDQDEIERALGAARIQLGALSIPIETRLLPAKTQRFIEVLQGTPGLGLITSWVGRLGKGTLAPIR